MDLFRRQSLQGVVSDWTWRGKGGRSYKHGKNNGVIVQQDRGYRGKLWFKKKQNNFTLAMLPLRYRRERSGDEGEMAKSSGLGFRRSLLQHQHGIQIVRAGGDHSGRVCRGRSPSAQDTFRELRWVVLQKTKGHVVHDEMNILEQCLPNRNIMPAT